MRSSLGALPSAFCCCVLLLSLCCVTHVGAHASSSSSHSSSRRVEEEPDGTATVHARVPDSSDATGPTWSNDDAAPRSSEHYWYNEVTGETSNVDPDVQLQGFHDKRHDRTYWLDPGGARVRGGERGGERTEAYTWPNAPRLSHSAL
jgi:hypothetical protein